MIVLFAVYVDVQNGVFSGIDYPFLYLEPIDEAQTINRSFHESVRFPAQDGFFELVLKKRFADNQFGDIWRIKIEQVIDEYTMPD